MFFLQLEPTINSDLYATCSKTFRIIFSHITYTDDVDTSHFHWGAPYKYIGAKTCSETFTYL